MALDKHSEKWIKEQEALVAEGTDIVKNASNEALEYLAEAVENINDKPWRKMVVSTQAVELGVGQAIVEHLYPVIYKDMEKNLHKRLKVSKDTARALRHIYIGRVIKNITRSLNERGES